MVEYVEGGGPERWAASAALLGEVFQTDPVMRYMLHHRDSPALETRIQRMLHTLVKFSATSGGAIFDEAWTSPRDESSKLAKPVKPGDVQAPACSALWIKPGHSMSSVSNYFTTDAVRLLSDVGASGMVRIVKFQNNTDRAKASGLRNPDGSTIKDYYYLFFIGTAATDRGQGLGGEVVRRFQARAAAENLPIWLESTTPGSHRLYLRLGFQDKSSWIMGEGEVDEKGFRKKGGAGVRLWAMLWRPGDEPKKTSDNALA